MCWVVWLNWLTRTQHFRIKSNPRQIRNLNKQNALTVRAFQLWPFCFDENSCVFLLSFHHFQQRFSVLSQRERVIFSKSFRLLCKTIWAEQQCRFAYTKPQKTSDVCGIHCVDAEMALNKSLFFYIYIHSIMYRHYIKLPTCNKQSVNTFTVASFKHIQPKWMDELTRWRA